MGYKKSIPADNILTTMMPLKRTFLFYILLLSIGFGACNGSEKKPAPAPAADTPVLINNKQIVTPANRKNSYADVDISPMDMTYYPPNYPQLKMTNSGISDPVMRVVYSRPHLQGRTLFHDILKYDEPWRLGANEATELQVFQTVTVKGNKLNKGRYTLHCIPHENEWTIAINSVTDIWGLRYDPAKDIFTVRVPATHGNPGLEYFTMVFEKTETGANLLMAWGDVLVKLPFTF